MKVNLKKMGAIVAGATMLASSAAFAGLLFGSTTLVDDNGAPVAKVVIGSNSAPSDGVAGALIAGKIASEAYKSQTLTAEVSGTADCVAGEGSEETAGTCSISNEKARLEITVPGSVAAGTWQGDNLIGDYLNRELEDRIDNIAGDSDAEYEIGGSDTSDNANPFTDGNGGDIGLSNSFLYKIDGGQFSTFQDVTVTDADAGNTYVEMQSMWLQGSNRFDSDPDDIVGDLEFLAYALKFDGPGGDEIGIPVCTDSNDNDYTYCKTADGDIDDASETHRVKVMFLGEEWIISEMNAPSLGTDAANDGLLDENTLVNGGSVKLAKESIGGILNQGEFLQVDDLKFQLDDLEAHGDTTSAILSILDANDNILEKEKVNPGETQEFNINGNMYRFHVYKVAPGYTFGAKWADVAIFSHEIECEDGQDLDSDEDTNPDYTCALGWKNLDAETAAANEGDPEAPDALRTLVVYAEDIEDISSSGEDTLEAGDYVPIVQNPDSWRLSYKGLDITSEDRHSLKFEIKTQDKDISESKGPQYNPGNAQSACIIYAPYVDVSSGDSGSVFEIDRDDGAGAGSLSDDQFYVAVNDVECDTDDDGVVDTVLGAGSVLMKISPSSDDYGVAEYAGPGLVVRYDDIGDGDDAFAAPNGGAIAIQDVADIDGAGDGLIGDLLDSAGFDTTLGNWNTPSDFMFGIAEKAGTGSSNEYVDYFVFGLQGATVPADATFDFDSDDGSGNTLTSDSEEILYGHATAKAPANAYDGADPISGPVNSGFETVEEGYISERGSVFDAMDDDKVEFEMTHTLARAQWWLGPTSTSGASDSTTVVTLGEGESTTVSGVTVKVLEITEDVGACSAAGGAVSCTADMSGVSAVIMPNNAPSVEVAMPYTGDYGNLVVLDTDAVGVNTLVSVGGDAVNTVTADLLQGSAVDWAVEKKVVREVVQGSKIVVAGETAADTLEAAQDFVSQVQKV